MVAAERRVVDERVKKIIELKNKVLNQETCNASGENGEGLKSVDVSESETKVDEAVDEGNVVEKDGESSKESDVSVVPARTLSRYEEYLEWDEIHDVEGNDENKVSHGESASKADTRKRLSVVEVDDDDDDDDLSWNIEDDDELEKAGAK
ncbi:hypothetical protein POM88_001830 [Heracleum sosnowskyi]|uniref:Uncharacterized protein n=1 Tax=Heracleum sosnowskyi TaxID=360622 RepID=A0AAD8N5E0_9APIA|nr:hypothetical protein POM88_001830 [Heracleum sosnowskyi]